MKTIIPNFDRNKSYPGIVPVKTVIDIEEFRLNKIQILDLGYDELDEHTPSILKVFHYSDGTISKLYY